MREQLELARQLGEGGLLRLGVVARAEGLVGHDERGADDGGGARGRRGGGRARAPQPVAADAHAFTPKLLNGFK